MLCNKCSSGNIKMERTQKDSSSMTIIVTIIILKLNMQLTTKKLKKIKNAFFDLYLIKILEWL